MATRGRKPKPTAVKVLEGNPGKRPLNMFEPTPEKIAPECPSWLNDEAKAEWNRLVDKMVELGILKGLPESNQLSLFDFVSGD